MNAPLINRAKSELSGNVMTETRPLTQDERLRVWWLKRNLIQIKEIRNES
jgi:methylthioribose-1-phosphate isomerase